MELTTLKERLSSLGEGSEIPAVTDSQLKLANPITTVANALKRLFESDKDVTVTYIYDKENPEDPETRVNVWKAKIMVSDAQKAEAINQILKHKISVGEEGDESAPALTIEIWDCSGDGAPELCPAVPAEMTRDGEWDCFKRAFRDNRDLDMNTFDVEDNYGRIWHFAEFSNRVMSYENDDLRQKEGFSAIVPADLVCVFFKGIVGCQIATYARHR